MICAIRISGEVGLRKEVIETLNRLRLRKKYSCIVINPNKEQMGMIKKMRDYIAFGEISDEMFEKLVEKRAQLIGKDSPGSSVSRGKTKKIDAKKVVEGIKSGKKYKDMNLKPYFRLHPPRKGIKSKTHYPKGALGNHKDKINELIERML